MLTDIAAGGADIDAVIGTDQSVVLRSRGDHPARRTRRETSAVDTVDRRDVDKSSIGHENKVGLGDMLDEERDLEMRDLGADDDLGRRSEVRDVDYDYIFGNDANDDEDELVSIIIIIIIISSSSNSSISVIVIIVIIIIIITFVG